MLILFLTRSWRLHRPDGPQLQRFRERPCFLPTNTLIQGALLGKMAQGTFYHPRFPFWLWVQNIDPQKRKEKLLGFCSDPAGHWGSLGFQCSFQHDHPTYYFDPIDINSLDPAMSTSCSEPPFVETVRGSLGHCRRLNGLERDVGPSPSCIDLK